MSEEALRLGSVYLGICHALSEAHGLKANLLKRSSTCSTYDLDYLCYQPLLSFAARLRSFEDFWMKAYIRRDVLILTSQNVLNFISLDGQQV